MAEAAKTGAKKKNYTGRVRMLDGKVVKPVLYNGKSAGLGKYFAGAVNEQLVCDENGKPYYFREIGQLV